MTYLCPSTIEEDFRKLSEVTYKNRPVMIMATTKTIAALYKKKQMYDAYHKVEKTISSSATMKHISCCSKMIDGFTNIFKYDPESQILLTRLQDMYWKKTLELYDE